MSEPAPSPPPAGHHPPGAAGSLRRPNGFYLRQLDLFRAVTCLCVVGQHAVLWPVPGGAVIGWSLVMVLHYTRNAFFFLSAFVAAYGQATRPRSVGALWWRRLTQVLVPYLVWTAIYFGYTMITSPEPFGRAMSTLGTDLYNGYYQLYFVVVLVQFYVLLPGLLWLVRVSRRHHGKILMVSVAFQLLMGVFSHYFSSGPGTGVPGDLHQVASFLLGSRLIFGYQLYLVAGLLAAAHVDELQRLVVRHWRGIAALAAAAFVLACGYYAFGVAIGETPGKASDLYQPVATVWFVAAVAGLCALGWGWAQAAARRPGRGADRLVTRVSDMSGGFYFSHVLVLQLVLSGLGAVGLRSAAPWGAVSAALYVGTVAGTAVLVSLLLRTRLRWVLTGPDRTAERSSLDWYPPPVGTPSGRQEGAPVVRVGDPSAEATAPAITW